MPDVKIAAVYIRVSTEDQAELSPDSQLEVVRSYAAKSGYIVPQEYVFVDEGISGRTAAKRPAFNRMVATAKDASHPFDTILVWKFSRFARNQEESVFYKSMLRRDRVEVVSVSEPLIDGPFGSLIERILEWMDEYYSIRLSGEVKRSMTLNAERGVRQIAPPFGYRLEADGEKRAMRPDPVEAPLVRELFERFLSGGALYALAKDFNLRGVMTHRGAKFENRTVEYILRNPVYVGMLRWTPSGKCRRDFKNPDTIISKGAHEPIVSQELFDAVQERMSAVKSQWGYKARPTYELKDWLGGIVRCADCGSTLIFSKPHYFKCNNYVRGRCRFSQHVSVELLHEAFLTKLHEDADSSTELHYVAHYKVDSPDADELLRLRAALELSDKKLARVRDSYASGIDTLDEYKRYREDIKKERDRLTSRISELEAVTSRDYSDALRASLREALSVLDRPDATKEEKNASARSIVESCTFSKSTNMLTFVYRVFI